MSSKIGPHVIQPTSAALAWAQHAPIVKAVDDPTPLRQSAPGAVTVFRKYWPDAEMNARIAGMAVDETVRDIVQALGGFVPVYIDGPFNEVAQRQGLGLEQHADFMAAFVPAIKAALPGVKVVAFGFSTGNPGSSAFGDRDDFQYLYNRQWCGVDAISMHCYFGLDGFDTAYALRYRALCSTVPSHPPVLISECGVDAVPGGAKGWMAAGLSAAEYGGLLAAYDAELARDKYVIGATVFTAGATADWVAFNTDSLDARRFYTFGSYDNTGDVAMGTPSNDTLQAQNGLNAKGEYDLAQALIAVMNGDKDKAVSLLFDGAQSTFGQLNAIDPAAFPVPSRP